MIKPHKVHFCHSDERLGKYTFLKLCTMHFGPARTKVNLNVIARMVARTFPKTPAHARLWPSPGAFPGTPVDLKVSSGTTLNH